MFSNFLIACINIILSNTIIKYNHFILSFSTYPIVVINRKIKYDENTHHHHHPTIVTNRIFNKSKNIGINNPQVRDDKCINIISLKLANDDNDDDNNDEDIFENVSNINNISNTCTGHEDDMDLEERKKERAMISLGSSIGLSRNEALDFLRNYPQLHTEVDNLNLRILYFMNEMGITKQKLYQMIMQQPGLTATSLLDDELKSTIEVLQSELNLTTDEVWKLTTKSFPQIMRYNRNDLRRKLSFYRFELKLTEKELKRLVLIQPGVLRHLPCELQETLDTFKIELDCTAADFKAMILKFPLLLTYSTKSKLLPCLKYIKQSEIGIGLGLIKRAGDPSTTSLSTTIEKETLIKKRVKAILLQYPNLLAFSIDNNIKPTIQFLLNDIGLSVTQVGKVIWRFPEVLGLSIENNLRPKIKYLTKSLHITTSSSSTNNNLASLIERDPRILGFNMISSFPIKINFFINELYFTIDELRTLFIKRPQILTLSISSNIKPKIDYYKENCHYLTTQELKQWILDNPAELTFNLKNRIIPRLHVLKENNLRLLKDTPANIISKSEKSFLEWLNEKTL